jgi:inner membrane protein
MENSIDRLAASARSSKMLRLLWVGILVLVLQIPIAMIGRLVWERETRRTEAIREVSSKWGGTQTVTGPALIVPYAQRFAQRSADGKDIIVIENRTAVFLPERLAVRGNLDSEVRERGIFSVPVFTLDAVLEGEFARPSFAELGIEPSSVAWDRAHLVIGISDARAIQRETRVTWNGREVPFVAGTGSFSDTAVTGIHAQVGVPEDATSIAFSLPLALNGSTGMYFTPFGQSTVVELQSDFGHPSFQGNWLPTERTVANDQFRATWSIPSLGRNYPRSWTGGTSMIEPITGSRFGVELVAPVDHYRMSDRSVKYAALFILLTFATVWLVEVLAGVRVHPIQYLMLGAALCLFYLLVLSLSEHLGFPLAYATASAAVVAMVGAFCLVALQRASRAGVVAAGVALLYGYLYVLLMNEDYALVIGSIGLFAALAAIMFATRRVDWYTARPGRDRAVGATR